MPRPSTTVCLLVALCGAVPARAQVAAPGAPGPDDRGDAIHPVFQHAAPRTLPGARRAQDRHPLPPDDAADGLLQSGDWAAWPRLWRQDGLVVTGSLTGTLGLFSMSNNLFDPPASLNPAGLRADPRWNEFFVEPGVSAQYTWSGGVTAYAGAAVIETATRGTDYDGVSNTYHGGMELLYAGVRWKDATGRRALDVSYGQQDFTVANNLLLAAGASNGAQRGASYMGPRAAWANAALARLKLDDWAVQAFWLKPNETTSGATGTRLAGINVDWTGGPLSVGAMYVRAPESAIVTRDGLDTYNLRAAFAPAALPGAKVQGEYVWQRKDGVDASGWYVEGTYTATAAPWKPLATLRYSAFSGDRPDTPDWEGFDPLYYGGSNPDWYQGKVGSTLFGNTNLTTWVAALTLAPTPVQLVQVVALYFQVDQVDAPLAVPPAGKPVPTGGGVPARALGTEVDVVYTYTFSKAVNANLFGGYLAPGAGYRELYAANGGSARDWWVLGMQLNVSY